MQSASSGSSADSNVGRPDWSNPQTPSTTLNILCVTIPIIGPGEAAGGIAVDVADSGGTVNRDLVFSAGRPHVPFGAGLRPCTTVRRDDDTTSGGIRSAYPIRENGRRLIHEEHEAHKGHKENPNSLRRIASVGGAAQRQPEAGVATNGETVDTWPVAFVNLVPFVLLCEKGAEGADVVRSVVSTFPREAQP